MVCGGFHQKPPLMSLRVKLLASYTCLNPVFVDVFNPDLLADKTVGVKPEDQFIEPSDKETIK